MAKMATGYVGEATLDPKETGDQIKAILRRCRGRPRLTDSDRAQRRLESRKKYDVRRVYLGESHKIWSELRRQTTLSDAGLAEYLILLNSAYGERYQQRYGGKKTIPELCGNQRKSKRTPVTSLQTLVGWYQEHSQTCPHEPQLKALEPVLGLSTSVLWQCDAGHSFVQHLSWPAGGGSESEAEDEAEAEAEAEAEGEPERETRVEMMSGVNTRGRRKARQEELNDPSIASADVSQAAHVTVSHEDQIAALAHLTASASVAHDCTSGTECPAESQPVWEMEVVMEGQAAQALGKPDHKGSCVDAGRDPGLAEDGVGQLGMAAVGLGAEAVPSSYECVVVTQALMDRPAVHDGDGSGNAGATLLQASPAGTMPMQGQAGELFEPQTLQTVVSSCELPEQRGTLEASQLIIITGPSYEALTSEGIQLNMGSSDGEEVTCAVIEGMAYNQMCQAEAGLRGPITDSTEAVTVVPERQQLQPTEEVHSLRTPSTKELQRSLSRSKRRRRGPVIEADGMLKMFHCPYEGCSQVYVAISSFQNHVNLVHRKGRTKVCPHPGCGKKFYLSNHLHRHMIIHSGVRDFICETCGKSFKRKNHLEVHRRTHTGETPLQCEICGYQCRQRASLNWHMKKHTPEAHYNFTCEHCGKRFEKLDSVKFHKLKSHPEKQAV
ncbi:zinc finger protein 653 [Sardina pilchardus]|uniref:zinc finger protein 653 n=1 Tax=Sardina pilchardus TaxID=27697 RepID=UPI002E0F62FB